MADRDEERARFERGKQEIREHLKKVPSGQLAAHREKCTFCQERVVVVKLGRR